MRNQSKLSSPGHGVLGYGSTPPGAPHGVLGYGGTPPGAPHGVLNYSSTPTAVQGRYSSTPSRYRNLISLYKSSRMTTVCLYVCIHRWKDIVLL